MVRKKAVAISARLKVIILDPTLRLPRVDTSLEEERRRRNMVGLTARRQHPRVVVEIASPRGSVEEWGWRLQSPQEIVGFIGSARANGWFQLGASQARVVFQTDGRQV